MEKTALNASNYLYLIISIITFIISFFPILKDYKVYLLAGAISLIVFVYFSLYMGSVNKVEKRVLENEKKIENSEKVLNTIMNLITMKEMINMKKKGQISADDVLELIKIGIIIVIGFIIIKALLGVA